MFDLFLEFQGESKTKETLEFNYGGGVSKSGSKPKFF